MHGRLSFPLPHRSPEQSQCCLLHLRCLHLRSPSSKLAAALPTPLAGTHMIRCCTRSGCANA